MSWFANFLLCLKCGYGARPPSEKEMLASRKQLAHNLHEVTGFCLFWGWVLWFWMIVLALHIGLKPIFFGWWLPCLGILAGMSALSRHPRMFEFRGPLIAIACVVFAFALLWYLSTYHLGVISIPDSFGKRFRELFAYMLLNVLGYEEYQTHPWNIHPAWWWNLVPVWIAALCQLSYLYVMRAEIQWGLPHWKQYYR
jgi:hypothetical protein